ncbi:hypothetical protein I7I48_03769 [Histoplasma ohiense]|nr:hypothetical protein I7I48_03769 [Histoplasma ohiense (nom. inval.)]
MQPAHRQLMTGISPQQRPRLRIPLMVMMMMMVTMMMAMMMTIALLTLRSSSSKPAMVYPLLPFEPTANSRT